MYYLGLDPSTTCTGYCVMDKNYDIIESGKIPIPKNATESEKIVYQLDRIEPLFTKYTLTKTLCEDQFSKLNIDTVKKLSRVTGGILYLAKKNNVDVELIYPTSWRKVFHGSGKAKKEHTFDKVVALYEFEGLTFKKDNDHTDSIGIAWAAVDLDKEGVVA